MQIIPLLDMLTTGTIEYLGVTYPVLHFEVTTSQDLRPDNLEFSWEIVDLQKRSALFKLIFRDAMQVSAYGSPDILSVTFRDPYMFVGVNNLAIRDRSSTRAD